LLLCAENNPMLLRVLRIVVLLLWITSALLAAEPSGIWLDVPLVKQSRNGCGAASIAMVMQYWQRQQGPSEDPNAEAARIQHALHSDAVQGIRASSMEMYFQRNGYRVFAFPGEWRDLEEHVKKGRPLIVAVKPGRALPLHYVVVAGLDSGRQLVLLNDPAERKLLTEVRSRFEKEWNAAGAWTLLALPEASSR
jgi:ABC-type bacteriocin/lantibiotic exporter with double-glycine peptidase domain